MAAMSGFIWRKYACPIPLGEVGMPELIRRPEGRLYPELMRWDLIGAAFAGFVRPAPDLLPQAVCYDLQTAFSIVRDDVLGSTGSRVVDMVELSDFMTSNLLGCFAGPDTPYFFSDSGSWLSELRRFSQSSR